jgi:hypothetical protein
MEKKKAILAQVVEFDTFTLLAHEVLEVEVVVFFSVIVAMWVVKGFFYGINLEVVLVF